MESVKIIKFLDKYFGFIICLILSLNKLFPKKNSIHGKKILLVQLWGLGETVLCLPAIKALREENKESKIDVLVTKRVKDVFYENSDLNNIIEVALNPLSLKLFILKNFRKYDIVIDMEEYLNISSIIAFFLGKKRIGYNHGIRSLLYDKTVSYNDQQHVSQTFMDLLKPLGVKKKVHKLLSLNYSSRDKKNVDSLLKKNSISNRDFVVGFGIGLAESVKERMWPEERYAQIADYLIKNKKAKVIFMGSKNESEIVRKIQSSMKETGCYNFCGKTNVRELFYLISTCKLFIGNDSGPMHVAAAQGVKTIGLFGCNLPVRFAPLGSKNISIRKQIGKACINVHKGEVGTCKNGKENACVKKIKVIDVIDSLKKL
ncbi:glycosyltransferase family 9 protein [Candidatus Woesearchaeota archaeon]|nr:glycosyltransferase family 9 protein [Candidatus Woesearchaeota archaeon]